MADIISKIISDTLTSLYQPFWFSVLSAALFLFLYLYATEHGWKAAFRNWLTTFKASIVFRRLFFLSFFTMMILMRTLLNRTMWANPVSNVIGTWGLYNDKGELTTECIENIMLMLPFTFLLLWTFSTRLLQKVTLGNAVWAGMKFSFLFSISIEFLQLFLRLGTFQLSDIFYNTLGGTIGGLIYYLCIKLKKNDKRAKDKEL